jgi:hypothetical protein
LVTIDTVANTMRVQVSFTGLTTNTTAAHIHCCTAFPDTGTVGVATTLPAFPGFPLGVTAGTYDHTPFDLTAKTIWNPAFITAHGGTPAGAEASATCPALRRGPVRRRSTTVGLRARELYGPWPRTPMARTDPERRCYRPAFRSPLICVGHADVL